MRNMVKVLSFTALAALMIFSFGTQGWAGEEETSEVKMQSVCPIMGNPINKDVFADHDGKRVYFCCAGCIGTFNADPAAFITKMEKDGLTLAKTPSDDHGEKHDHGEGHDHDKDHDHDKGHGHDDHHGHDHG